MGKGTWRLSGDLSTFEQGLLLVLVFATVALLLFEVRRRRGAGVAVATTGVLGALALALAVARPVSVQELGLESGARVVVLVDRSERMTLPSDDATSRRQRAAEAVASVLRRFEGARAEVFGFGSGALLPALDETPEVGSALLGALEKVTQLPGDRAAAVVVVSDGRLTTPGPFEPTEKSAFEQAVARTGQGLPVHTVAVTRRAPRDLAIRSVRRSGTAVAHQSFPLVIEAGCEPANDCPEQGVVVRELLENAEPVRLGQGRVTFQAGLGVVELGITLERAGGRMLEVAFEEARTGDEVPANDRRFVPIEVRRDRMRILHVAGRPTYDVRALRMFLKADESIDLVSFFILRTLGSRVNANDSELALIPFPVDELFTEHLPSFDAIILQDIDAREYNLDRHFEAMRDYVQKGGGLILVGGPGGFGAGGYAQSPLETVLPVSVPSGSGDIDQKPFTPRYTPAGAVAPMLAGLRELLDRQLPRMAGANRLGPARPSALVLWDHPELTVSVAGQLVPMPLLALAEVGDGRSIALAVDATHELRFGELGAEAAGRGHSALWEGLLGWLMRDPRYEAARIEAPSTCFAGKPFELRVTALPGMGQEVELTLGPLGSATPLGSAGVSRAATSQKKAVGAAGEPVVFRFDGVLAGAYVARSKLGAAPPTRLVFACEEGGGALSDSRPDAERLERIAAATGGRAVDIEGVGQLPVPASTRVLAQSSTRPLVPDWVWASLAVVILGAHWWLRRAGGFA